MKQIRNGVYPTMITPFTDDNHVDYAAIEALVEYYAASGCDGIFALCLSSEIFHLSDKEMQKMMRFIADKNNGRMSLIASGHTSLDVDTQIDQLKAMCDNGAEQAVLILNRLGAEHDGEDFVRRNCEKIFNALPDITFGVYECPVPYKRMVSTELISWFAQTGRVGFIKDTCCDLQMIKDRLAAVGNSGIQLFNANTATLLDSMRAGAAGFSGVMANFHADLYAALYRFYQQNDPRADQLQAFLTIMSAAESKLYPVNAKYHLRYNGIQAGIRARNKDMRGWNATLESETRDMYLVEEQVRALFGLK